MLDVLFSHSYYYKLDPKQWSNQNPYPPLGTLFAASLLRKNNYSVGLFDTNLKDGPESIEKDLLTLQPKFMVLYDDGFNYLTKMCLTNMRDAAFKMIGIGKKQGCLVVVNSSDATDHYQKYLDQGADFVIQGEGEQTLLELIDGLQKNNDISNLKGLIFLSENKTIVNPKREVLRELDTLPLPAWDLVDMASYKEVWKKSGKPFTLNMATTRGCPFKCNWCAKPIYGNRYNSHSPKYVVEHLKVLKETYDVKRFWMCDDIFGLKPNWVQEFNRILKREQLSISYYIQSRVDLLLKDDTINALAESGLEEVWVGAESGSQKILDAMDKGITVEQIKEATKRLRKKGIRVSFFIQYGYLGETQEDIQKTIDMIKDLCPDNLGISVSYPLPGTKFYNKVKEELNIKSNWTDSDDLAMLFQGTYNSRYYKTLHRYTHKEYRKSQALKNLKSFVQNPLTLFAQSRLRSMSLYLYYVLSAWFYKFQLKSIQMSDGK
ncbi:B12-binding domain-containing radical SAM protein [Aestuariivivens sediminis]|uniref:B12-binding domain-containing radical SAM protein n=1 Tax=Aestuariivivens sediminis TaxID=2913557 RepID=UPI001F58CB12|nr:radical SAM protein [Aestuariivivens sediminis]